MSDRIDPANNNRRIISINVDQIQRNDVQKRNVGGDINNLETPFLATLAEAIRRQQTTNTNNNIFISDA